ncbi:hypothetical protein BGZ72_003504 [Mortierella alpina]|nr:hypothetical protein BGZ72_003504 [Mortierella alpina]
MSAIATMKALMDAEKHRLAGHSLRGPSSPLTDPAQRPLPASPSEQPPQTQTQKQLCEKQSAPGLVPLPLSTPVLTIALPATPSATSSASCSPTTSTSSSSDFGSASESVSFSFCSPLFYDQKLFIYHFLLEFYRRLGRCIQEHPAVLLMLQYSVATVHGCTIYLLSVILSVAQLIMITFTLENLDWIQAHTPLMLEWDSRFPGFVFPAMDIDSADSEDECPDPLARRPQGQRKNSRYWNAQASLKQGDDLVDDGYQSEEYQQRWTIRQSMNSTLRKRLIKYQQWIPSLWNAEENRIQEDLEQEVEDDTASAESQESDERYSSRLRRALVRTLSGNIRSTNSKRVTFNEQVLVFGRRRSSQASQISVSSSAVSMTAISVDAARVDIEQPRAWVQPDDVQAPTSNVKQADNTRDMSDPAAAGEHVQLSAMVQDELLYQQRMASEDVNGSGSSSPLFKLDHPRSQATQISAPATPPSPPAGKPSFSSPSSAATLSSPATITRDLKRSISVPLKIGSFLHRHQHHNQRNNEPLQSTPRHSATFSESNTVSQNPRAVPAHLTIVDTPAVRLGTDVPSSPRTLPLLGLRARRSLSLGTARPNSHPSAMQSAKSDGGVSLERQGSAGRMNKNFMYRIVHPQRYKRELEQQWTEQERQRLLALANLQHQQFLASDKDEVSTSSSTGTEAAGPVLCGDAYYYATSAEYIEDLGAPNSVISTSYGISFPQELQRNKSKNIFKSQQRPASYDFGCPQSTLAHPTGSGYGSEGDQAKSGPGAESSQLPQQQQQFGLFKRASKKNGTDQRAQSPNRLHQLFFHPGHRQTQSTSSLLQPPGSHMSSSQTGTTSESSDGSGRTTPPVFSSSAAAGAHRLLSRGRSDSRAFTTFTALGMPSTQDPIASVPGSKARPAVPGLPFCASRDPAMEHTSFAAFGFPSPTQSPMASAPASPRHSTSSMPTDAMPSRLEAMNEFHANVVSGHTFVESDFGSAVDGDMTERQQQELLLDQEDELADGESHDTSFSSTSSGLSGNESMPRTSRGLSFMRRLSLRKRR